MCIYVRVCVCIVRGYIIIDVYVCTFHIRCIHSWRYLVLFIYVYTHFIYTAVCISTKLGVSICVCIYIHVYLKQAL